MGIGLRLGTAVVLVLTLSFALLVPIGGVQGTQNLQNPRTYDLDKSSYASLNMGRFAEPSVTGNRFLYSDLFAVYVEKGSAFRGLRRQ